MMLRVFAIFDEKAGAYLQPFFMSTPGMALRAFMDTLADPKSQFFAHPEDFTLYELAVFDDEKGEFDVSVSKRSLGTALELRSANQR